MIIYSRRQRLKRMYDRSAEWLWFAWYPVHVTDEDGYAATVWLQKVYRHVEIVNSKHGASFWYRHSLRKVYGTTTEGQKQSRSD